MENDKTFKNIKQFDKYYWSFLEPLKKYWSRLYYSKAQSAGAIEFKGLLICNLWMCLRIWSLNLLILHDRSGFLHWTCPLQGFIYLNQTILRTKWVWTQQFHLWNTSWIYPSKSMWNHSDQCSTARIKHWYTISYCHLAAVLSCPQHWWLHPVLWCQLSTGDAVPRCCVSACLSITGSSYYRLLLCMLRKTSNDFHLSMQLRVHRKFSIKVFSIFQVKSPKFKMTEIAYHWQIDQLIAYCLPYFCKLYAAENSMTSQNPSSPILQ